MRIEVAQVAVVDEDKRVLVTVGSGADAAGEKQGCAEESGTDAFEKRAAMAGESHGACRSEK